MKALLVCVLMVLLFLPLADAQNKNGYPTAELFGGFSLNHTFFNNDYSNAPGFQFSFGYNPTKYVRLVADVGGQYHSTDLFLFDRKVSTSNYQIMFGPELVLRNKSKVTPFVHVLGGWATRRYNVPTGFFECTSISCSEQKETVVSDSGGSLAAGGGVDVAVTPSITIRAAQFDFIRTNMDRNTPNFLIDPTAFPPLPSWQSHYRIGVGVVLRFGQRR